MHITINRVELSGEDVYVTVGVCNGAITILELRFDASEVKVALGEEMFIDMIFEAVLDSFSLQNELQTFVGLDLDMDIGDDSVVVAKAA